MFFYKYGENPMKKALSIIFAFAIAIMMTASYSALAKDNVDVKETKIETNAWNFQQQNEIIDKLLEDEAIVDAYFEAETEIVTVTYNSKDVGVDNIRFMIEEMGYQTEIVEAETEETSNVNQAKK